jgi:hypothetical protein
MNERIGWHPGHADRTGVAFCLIEAALESDPHETVTPGV